MAAEPGFFSGLMAGATALFSSLMPPPPVPEGTPAAHEHVIIVADETAPLDLAIERVEALVSGGGHSLSNVHIIALGEEARRLGIYMPAFPYLREFQRHGGTLYVCEFDAGRQTIDLQPLPEGARILPDKTLPEELARRLESYCYTPPAEWRAY